MSEDLTPTKAEIIQLAEVIDHLVDALGDPSVSVRRAMVLVDIDAHPGTTQSALGERLKLEKSVVSRNVDWLYTHKCITHAEGQQDARESNLYPATYAQKHLQLALKTFGNHHSVLQKNLKVFMGLFTKHMPSLREVKALLTVSAKGNATRADILNNLYDGPATTDQRAIRTLIEEGLMESNDG